jgi:hypothetical protein
MPSKPALVAADPYWFPYRFEEAGDNIHFRHLTRDDHRRATFLTDEYLGAGDDVFVMRRGEAMGLASPTGPVHFIFHSAFCCSTLLARAFDIPGVSMGLKEPWILNDIAGWRLRGAPGPRVAEAMDHALALMARPMAPGETSIVKPSNIVNGLAPAMLQLRPEARAVLLSAPLPVFLKSIAKKGLNGRLWVRDLMTKQIREGYIDLGFSEWDYLGLTDLQAAAVGWLAQQSGFAKLAAQYPDRVQSLDSETLLARPRETLSGLATLYGLAIDRGTIDKIIDGPAFTTDSKTGEVFELTHREAGYAAAAVAHSDEIEKVAIWATAVAQNVGVGLDTPLTGGA